MRGLIGIVFLLFQLCMVLYARFVPSRYFCWAPNDYMVEYRLRVTVAGHELGPQESFRRYRLPEGGLQLPVQHIMDIVQQYEQTYGKNDHACVAMRYCVNGHEEREWRWPAH
jgi:hypothetical protein